MIERFEGEEGVRRLRESLGAQLTLGGREDLISRVIAKGELLELKSGDVLCKEGDSDCDVYFLIYGAGVQVLIGGVPMAVRGPGEIIGEMAAVDSTAPRSATVRAAGPTVVLRLPEADFYGLSASSPEVVVKGVARTVAARLRERSRFIRPRSATPKLFIGSSVEQLEIARALQLGLDHGTLVPQVWTNSVFKVGSTAIEDLTAALNEFDFAAFILAPDDTSIVRNVTMQTTRDNVIFEMGLFIGALGRDRVFGILPRGSGVRRPSDLFGVAFIDYDDAREVDVALSTVCTQIRRRVEDKGPR